VTAYTRADFHRDGSNLSTSKIGIKAKAGRSSISSDLAEEGVAIPTLEGGCFNMPTNKEFAIRLEDKPGILGKVCQELADRGVNLIAFQAAPSEGKNMVRVVVDNPTSAKSVLDSQRLTYTQTEVAQVRLANRAGELARAATKLGDSNININYAYCGLESGTNAPVLIFGVTDAGKAATILDQAAAGAAGR
jgi:hypothetical protein